MRIGLVLLALLATWTATGLAQSSLEDFDFLLGDWEGELEYLDYQDDETLVRLPTTMRCEPSETGMSLMLAYTYGEPDGRRVDGREALRPADQEGELYFDGRWRVVEASFDPEADRYQVVLGREGMDNERPAVIRKTILLTGGELTITKEVLYDGESEYLQRNQHRFVRLSPEPPTPTP